jgi:hypothetical protein
LPHELGLGGERGVCGRGVSRVFILRVDRGEEIALIAVVGARIGHFRNKVQKVQARARVAFYGKPKRKGKEKIREKCFFFKKNTFLLGRP